MERSTLGFIPILSEDFSLSVSFLSTDHLRDAAIAAYFTELQLSREKIGVKLDKMNAIEESCVSMFRGSIDRLADLRSVIVGEIAARYLCMSGFEDGPCFVLIPTETRLMWEHDNRMQQVIESHRGYMVSKFGAVQFGVGEFGRNRLRSYRSQFTETYPCDSLFLPANTKSVDGDAEMAAAIERAGT